MIKKIIGSFILIFTVIFFAEISANIYQEMKIKNYAGRQEKTTENIQKVNEKQVTVETKKELNLIPKTYQGYAVSSKLKIAKINVDTYVLEKYSKESMEVSIAKYFGTKPNEKGNYCIAGHNYVRKNMFSELKKLQVEDELSLTDNIHGTVDYVIFDKYKVTPNQTQPLSQQTNGEKQITLITCSDYSKKRIIIKARAKENI